MRSSFLPGFLFSAIFSDFSLKLMKSFEMYLSQSNSKRYILKTRIVFVFCNNIYTHLLIFCLVYAMKNKQQSQFSPQQLYNSYHVHNRTSNIIKKKNNGMTYDFNCYGFFPEMLVNIRISSLDCSDLTRLFTMTQRERRLKSEFAFFQSLSQL